MSDRPEGARRPKSPEKLIERIRNRSERRIKRWREQLQTRIGKERQRRRERIAEILASLNATDLSDRGAEFIADHEGVILHAYNDPVGHCTVGVGHLIHLGPCSVADFREWANLTRERAMRLLQKDADRFERALRRLVRVKLEQHEFDALLSFVFNVGEGAFASSTLLRKLNAGDRAAIPGELMRWVNAGGSPLPGLIARRKAEGRLFARGDYS